jgi:hypothetical protein
MEFVSKSRITSFALLALVAFVAPASAETIFEAELTGSQEVPPTDSTAYGTATIILNDAQTEATYTVAFAGLDYPQTAAHFHLGAPGENGPPIFTLDLGSPLAGVWPLTVDDVTALLNEEVYVNIHTEGYPGGEIRGDFEFVTVATEPTTWSQLKSLY